MAFLLVHHRHLHLFLAVGMLACFTDVLLSIFKDPDGIVQRFLVEQRSVVVGHRRILRFIKIKCQTTDDVEGWLIISVTTAVTILRLLVEFAVVCVGTGTDWLDTLRCQHTLDPRQQDFLIEEFTVMEVNGVKRHLPHKQKRVCVRVKVIEHTRMRATGDWKLLYF